MTQLCDDLVQGGSAAVRALVGRHETLDLDFKLKASPGKGGDKDNRRVLGKALSAFANSMGGLIVWGVRCKRDEDGVDQVTGFEPVTNLARFASDMRDWTVEALMPRHAGITVHALDEGDDSGFLLVDVERSERRPHYCEFGTKGYYRRVGSSSRQMEHYEIEEAFDRVSKPTLTARVEVVGGLQLPANQERLCGLVFKIALENLSNVSARFPYVSVADGTGYQIGDLLNNGLRVSTVNRVNLMSPLNDGVVHPGTSILCGVVHCNIKAHIKEIGWVAPKSQLPSILPVSFGCLDVRKQDIELPIKLESIITALPNIRFDEA